MDHLDHLPLTVAQLPPPGGLLGLPFPVRHRNSVARLLSRALLNSRGPVMVVNEVNNKINLREDNSADADNNVQDLSMPREAAIKAEIPSFESLQISVRLDQRNVRCLMKDIELLRN
jgi:hypothetical protein